MLLGEMMSDAWFGEVVDGCMKVEHRFWIDSEQTLCTARGEHYVSCRQGKSYPDLIIW